MKKVISIKTKSKKYNIIFEKNSILKFLEKEKKRNRKIYIIIDKKLNYLIKNLKISNTIHILKIDGGEKIKSIKYYKSFCEKLLKLKVDRNSTLISIGGGTVGDLSGFIASTILRGIRFILIPSTLLAQVDSSIGGKNGINTNNGKNLIGTFYQPDKVIIDIGVLTSLPKREIKSGYAEILKHSIIKNNQFFNWLNKNYNKIISLETTYISKAIIDSIKIKSYFVQKDENEKLINNSSRAMLNFGHTFGHALEMINNYNTKKINHGEAIAIGMGIATEISFKKKLISKNDYEKILNHLIDVGFYKKNYRIKNNKIFKAILMDKKNSNNKINLILLKKIGKPVYKFGFKIEEVKKLLN